MTLTAILLLAWGQSGQLTHGTLHNGLEYVVYQDGSAQLSAVQLVVKAGSAQEGEGEQGLAHLFEHLMFGPTDKLANREYERFIEERGGRDNAWTDADFTCFHAVLAAEHLEAVLAMEANRLTGLRLTQEDLDRERQIVTEELRMRVDNEVFSRVLEQARATLLAEHPYGHPTAGTPQDIEAADLAACGRFYRRYYHPGNVVLVVAGPHATADVLAMIRRYFGPIQSPAEAVITPPVPQLSQWPLADQFTVSDDLPVKAAIRVFALPPADHPDRPALDILLNMLTQDTVRPLRHMLVERKPRSVYTDVVPFHFKHGSLVAFFSVALPYRRNKTAHRHLGEALGEIGSFAWADEDAHERARQRLLQQRWSRVYFMESVAEDLAAAAVRGGDVRLYATYHQRLQAVSRDDITRVYQTWLAEDKGTRGLFTPQRVPLAIRLFGWLYPLVH